MAAEQSLLSREVLAALHGGFVESTLEMIHASAPLEIWPRLEVYFRDHVASMELLVETLAHPDDEPELYRSLAFFWLERRFEWTRYNQIMQYQTVLRGEADPSTFLRGGMASAFLSLLEGVLRQADVDRLIQIAAEPLELICADADEITVFIQQRAQDSVRLARARQRASLPLQRLRDHIADPSILTLLESYDQLGWASQEVAQVPVSLAWARLKQHVPSDNRLNVIEDMRDVAPLDARALEEACAVLPGLLWAALAALPDVGLITVYLRMHPNNTLRVELNPSPEDALSADGFICDADGLYVWTASSIELSAAAG
ncbi:MAG: hypothetical protein AAFV53_16305 [Myxococcota bacterium]